MDFLTFLQAFGGYFLAVGNYAYTWWASRQKDHQDDIDELRALLAKSEKDRSDADTALDRRIAKLENDMTHLPDRELVTDIRLALAKLEGTVGQLGEKVSGVAHIVGVIDDALRSNPK